MCLPNLWNFESCQHNQFKEKTSKLDEQIWEILEFGTPLDLLVAMII
jgi:hypothetical protein